MHHTTLQVMERDVAHWSAEWLVLPRMICTTGAALMIAEQTLTGLEPDPVRMQENLALTKGAILAEALSFELTRHMPRADAQALVKAASREEKTLVEAVAALTDAPLAWDRFADPASHTGEAGLIIDNILAAWQREQGRK